jgi:hypothetical protein
MVSQCFAKWMITITWCQRETGVTMAREQKWNPWLRWIAIPSILAGYVALGALTFQDSPNDPPIIVTLLSK